VHALLTSAGLKKSAAALAKEAKLQPKAFKREHDLLDVYNFYLTHNVKAMKKGKVPAASVVDAAKKVTSSSSSSEAEPKKTKAAKKEESDSDLSDSSEEEAKPKLK
jgi:hypothetical protein